MRKNKHVLRLMMTALAATAAAQAAEKIRFEDLQYRIAPYGAVLEHRGVKVVTIDGAAHTGRRLRLDPGRICVFSGDHETCLSVERVSRIEVSQGGRFFHHISNSAQIPVALGELFCGGMDGTGSPGCVATVAAVFSPVWAYTGATAPFYLVADGIAFLIPPKVYEIIQ
jgi:hypothetical protein